MIPPLDPISTLNDHPDDEMICSFKPLIEIYLAVDFNFTGNGRGVH
jgi:hypothetical protein